MLAGVNQTIRQRRLLTLPFLNRANDRRDLHEVRPRAGDDVDGGCVHEIAVARSTATCPTSMSSSNGMGAGPPVSMARTNAAAHAFWPLSCFHSLAFLKPGQP